MVCFRLSYIAYCCRHKLRRNTEGPPNPNHTHTHTPTPTPNSNSNPLKAHLLCIARGGIVRGRVVRSATFCSDVVGGCVVGSAGGQNASGGAANPRLACDESGARFPTEIYSRGCHIGSHACSLEANMRVINGIPLGCSLLLPVCTANSVQTLQVRQSTRLAQQLCSGTSHATVCDRPQSEPCC
jgi:hypothetical protein